MGFNLHESTILRIPKFPDDGPTPSLVFKGFHASVKFGAFVARSQTVMKILIRQIGLGIAAITTGIFFSSCDVDKKTEGKMPSVDIDVDPGKLPDVEIRGPKVTTGTKKVEIEVPTVDVEIPKEEDNE